MLSAQWPMVSHATLGVGEDETDVMYAASQHKLASAAAAQGAELLACQGGVIV